MHLGGGEREVLSKSRNTITPETVQLCTASGHLPGTPHGPRKNAVGQRANGPLEPGTRDDQKGSVWD